MKTSTRNRILVILVVLAMSAGLIVSGMYVLFSSVQKDETAGQTLNTETEDSTEEQTASFAGARKAVTGFFGSLQNGNVEEAYDYVADSSEDPFGLKKSNADFKKTIESEPEGARAILTEYFDDSASQYVREYAILDSLEEDGKKVFLVQLTSADFDAIVYPDEEKINQETQDYINEHLDELNQMVAEQSQEAADAHIQELKLENYYSKLKEATRNTRDQEVTMEVVVEEDADGNPLITEMNIRK